MAESTCELMWVKQLITKVGYGLAKPINLYHGNNRDNQIVTHVASNLVFHQRQRLNVIS